MMGGGGQDGVYVHGGTEIMETLLLPSRAWAEAEFSGACLGDARRGRRLVDVSARLAEHPQGMLPRTFSGWGELKAAYRMLENEEVTYEKVIDPHGQRVRRACQEPGEYLMIEDTTELNYWKHPGTEGLGRVSASGGHALFVHSTLGLRAQEWDGEPSPRVKVVGLFHQECWVRKGRAHSRKESVRSVLSRPRESQRWARVFREKGGPGPGARWTFIADREGDIYEVFVTCEEGHMDWIVRACTPRALEGEDVSAFEKVGQSPVLGHFSLFLRARPGQKARTAHLEVRACPVVLRGPWRPGGRQCPRAMNVVEVKERDAPAGVEPVHWVLLTSWPCETFDEGLRVVRAYACRWLIEEYHKALKTGTHVEETQRKTVERIETLLGILAVVAVRLVAMKLLTHQRPDEAPTAEEWEPAALKILELKVGKPPDGWTHRTTLIATARLGGFLARKSDGSPGWLTIWRGLQKLVLLTEGYALAQEAQKCG